MVLKKIFSLICLIVLFIGLGYSLYLNHLTQSRLDNLAEDVRNSFEDINSEGDSNVVHNAILKANSKKINELELRVNILEGSPHKKQLDNYNYSNDYEINELRKNQDTLKKQIHDREINEYIDKMHRDKPSHLLY